MKQNRRSFIKTGTTAVAGAIAASPFLTAASDAGYKLNKFGLITWWADDAMKSDWKGTLAKAAKFGFSEIEGGSSNADSPKQFLKFCREIGLKPIAGGAGGLGEMVENIQKYLDECSELNYKYMVVYWPWLHNGPFKLDDCKKSAELLNRIGEKAQKQELQFLWHNHDKEFHEMEDGLPFDYLMQHTDPELVNCEMDIYWVKKGGSDPLQYLKKYAGRYPMLHVKDMAPGNEQDFACPGLGIIDFVPIFREAKNQEIKHYIVERDNEPNEMECLESSAKFLKSIHF